MLANLVGRIFQAIPWNKMLPNFVNINGIGVKGTFIVLNIDKKEGKSMVYMIL